MVLSALNVRYRYVGNAIAFLIQFWFFVTPIVFASSQVTGVARVLLACNPVTGLVDAMRWSLLDAPAPPPVDLLSLASGAAVLFVGLLYFQRIERAFADPVSCTSSTSKVSPSAHRLGARPGPPLSAMPSLHFVPGARRSPAPEFWALRDVSFEVAGARSSASSAATAPARARC